MRIDKSQGPNARFAPWTAICILGLLAAMVFAVPSVVFAQLNAELSQDCETALVDNEHTITATVTKAGVPFAGAPLIWQIQGENSNASYSVEETAPGTYEFTYTGDSLGDSTTWLMVVGDPTPATLLTKWTADDQCSKSLDVTVGGWDKLKDRKGGGVSIAICGAGCTDSFNVYDVDLDSVQMAGVSPRRAKFRDSRLCEGVKDAYVDLVLRFKRKEVLKALEELRGELVEDEKVTLEVTGNLKDGTPFTGVWEPVIEKIKKRHKMRW